MIDLIIWALLFATLWGIWISLYKNGIDYVRRPFVAAIYFLIASCIIVARFHGELRSLLTGSATVPLIALGILFAMLPLVYHLARKYLRRPTSFIERYPFEFWLRMDTGYLIAKSFDILFQQLCVAVLVVLLMNLQVSLWAMIGLFALIFGGLHLPMIVFGNRTFGWYYTGFAILAALVFPLLISQVAFGVIYSYIIHWLFYLISGVAFWFYLDRTESA